MAAWDTGAGMADRVNGRPPAPTDERMDGVDWYEQDLTGVVHERVLFHELDASDATGAGARFVDCTFRESRFDRSRLSDSSLENCTFIRCRLDWAGFTACKFVGSLFDGCTLERSEVAGGDWSFTGFPGADLRHARITDVRLREADLTGARLEDAALTGCDLSGVLWSRADLRRCDLRGSDISSLEPAEVDLRGAIVDWPQAIAVAGRLGLDVRAD
jgi:uncharacterized protein YjbI with pentapeptide repeats